MLEPGCRSLLPFNYKNNISELAQKVWPKIKCWRGLSRVRAICGPVKLFHIQMRKTMSSWSRLFVWGALEQQQQEQTVDTKVSKLSCCNVKSCHLNQMAQTRKEPQMKAHRIFRYFWPYIASMFTSTFLQVVGASSLQLINPTYQTANRLLCD